MKGNCDAELVLQAMIDYGKYEKAVVGLDSTTVKAAEKQADEQVVEDLL